MPLNISHDQFHKTFSVHSDKKLGLWLPPVTNSEIALGRLWSITLRSLEVLFVEEELAGIGLAVFFGCCVQSLSDNWHTTVEDSDTTQRMLLLDVLENLQKSFSK